LDFGFCNGRINGSLDYYYKKTKDLLAFVPITCGTNFSNGIFTNVGNMNNHGFELSVNSTIHQKTKLNWDLGFNVTYNKNEITKLSLVDDPSYGVLVGGISGAVGNTVQIHTVGHQPYSFYLLQQVYDAGGKPIEGYTWIGMKMAIINNQDYYHYKSPEPLWLVGFLHLCFVPALDLFHCVTCEYRELHV
jgi:iron complex outermembrane receptor protein